MASASLLLARAASAERCALWPAVFPANGDTVSGKTHLWVVCAPREETCEPLILRDSSGAVVPIIEIDERHASDGPSRRIIRYAPRAELAPGNYELTDRAQHSLSFRVVASAAPPPRVPRLLEYRFTLTGTSGGLELGSAPRARLAHFALAADDGLLVADIGDATDDPVDAVSDGFARRAPGRYDFWLGWGACRSTFAEADYCTRTRVRFGTLGGEGTFSGWSPWQEVEFPGPDCAASAAREQRTRLERWGLAAAVAAFTGLWLLRRRHM